MHRKHGSMVSGLIPAHSEKPNTLSLVSFAGMGEHRPLDGDVNWMSPVQGKSPLVQVKEPYDNKDMVTCRLSSCSPQCTMYTC